MVEKKLPKLTVILNYNNIFSAVKRLITINGIQNKKQLFTYYTCVYLLCIYKYKHMHVNI